MMEFLTVLALLVYLVGVVSICRFALRLFRRYVLRNAESDGDSDG